MIMSTSKMLAAGLMMGLCVVAQAGIIHQETWETGASLQDWEIDPIIGGPGTGTLTPVAGGNPGGSLQVTEADLGVPEVDAISVSGGAGAPFLGDWTQTHPVHHTDYISFDFFRDTGSDAIDPGLNFYFVGGGVTWYYIVDVSTQLDGSWATYTIPVDVFSGSPAGWTPSVPSTFSSDVMSVSEIGFELSYATGTLGGQLYAFDNVRRGYLVPEPETYAAIGFALVALCMAFRRQLQDLLVMVRVQTLA